MSLKTTIRKNFNSLFVINYDLRHLIEKMIAINPGLNTIKDGVAYFILAKSFKTHGVAINLAKNGYSEDADILIRTLFDALLIISACLEDETEGTVLKFMRFDDTVRTKMYKSLKDQPAYKELFEERLKNPKPENEPIELIEKRTMEWRNEYGSEFWQKWHSGSTTGELADKVGMLQYFKTAYSLQSQFTHSLPRTMNFYLIEKKGKIVMDVYPKKRNVDMSLASAFSMLIVIADKFNNQFKLGLGDELKKLTNDWVVAVDKLKEKDDESNTPSYIENVEF